MFADKENAAFLAQQLQAPATYVDQIPMHLLIGPAAPVTALPLPPCHKYSVDMFSSAAPQYASPTTGDLSRIDKLLTSEKDPKSRENLIVRMTSIATKKLPDLGQSQGFTVGFFEQGILLGLGLTAFVILPTLSYGVWKGGRFAWQALSSRIR